MACVLINKDGDEITRYGFISHIEDYLKKLLSSPADACPDEYLQSHGVDGELALKHLLAKTDPLDDESAILIRKETIKKNPEGGREIFSINYRIPRKNYLKKMRNLYCSLFENHINTNTILNECDCVSVGGGAEGSSGQYDVPFGQIITKPGYNSHRNWKKKKGKKNKKVVLSEKQIEYIKEAVEMGTAFGDFGYDAPGLDTNDNNFWKESLTHNKKGGISTDRLEEE